MKWKHRFVLVVLKCLYIIIESLPMSSQWYIEFGNHSARSQYHKHSNINHSMHHVSSPNTLQSPSLITYNPECLKGNTEPWSRFLNTLSQRCWIDQRAVLQLCLTEQFYCDTVPSNDTLMQCCHVSLLPGTLDFVVLNITAQITKCIIKFVINDSITCSSEMGNRINI